MERAAVENVRVPGFDPTVVAIITTQSFYSGGLSIVRPGALHGGRLCAL